MDLLKEIQTVREYNRQLQNELVYKEEQLTIYKEGYEENKSKLDNMKNEIEVLNAKIEVYKENIIILSKELSKKGEINE